MKCPNFHRSSGWCAYARRAITFSIWSWAFCICQVGQASPPDVYDLYYDDNTTSTSNILIPNIPQVHSISSPSDVDWAVIHVAQGHPYSVRLEELGPGLDLQIEVYVDGLANTPILRNFAEPGADEVYSEFPWEHPSGAYWLAVSPVAIGNGPTTYSLRVTLDAGPNSGLATISKGSSVHISPSPALIQFDRSAALPNGAVITPIYTRSYLDLPSGTFGASDTQKYIHFYGLGDDPESTLTSPWVVKWFERWLPGVPRSVSIARVVVDSPYNPAESFTIGLQMRRDSLPPTTITVGQNSQIVEIEDIPPGEGPISGRIYRWLPAGDWELFDDTPWLEETAGSVFVTTTLRNADLLGGTGTYFAAELVRTNSITQVRNWGAYR